MKTILLFFITLLNLYSQNKVINTKRYLLINHKQGYNIHELYKSKELILESSNDTPYLKGDTKLIKEGWARYYDYSLKKFISKINGNKRVYPLENIYTFTDSIIYDSEYSSYKILSKRVYGDVSHYYCINISESTRENGETCELIVDNNYIFIQYKKYTYIYSN